MTLEGFQSWVIQTGLVVSLLIAIILLIRRPFARAFGANAAYALWSLPLIRLCLPGLSIPQRFVPEFLKQTSVETVIVEPFDAPVMALPAITGEPNVFVPSSTPEPEMFPWGVVLIGVWLSVAVLWLSYQLFQQARFKSKLEAQSIPPSRDLSNEIKRAAKSVGLHKIPSVRVSSTGMGPLVTGVLNPLVIVPSNFNKTFDTEQRQFALVHEFAHIKRRDLWVALTTLLFRAVNWPNPLVHYASHKLRGDQEAACDAFVVKVTGGKTAHSYAETLVKAVRQDRTTSQPNAHLALSLTEADTEISKGD